MEIHLQIGRRQLVAFVVVAAAVLGGVAYAAIPDAGGVYTACKLNATGTIRLIDPSLGSSSLLGHCVALESKITWNQTGQAGASPAVAQLAAGDANCPAGGASITDGSGGVAYVCNGTSFAGSFSSPNGQYGLQVGDQGVTLSGPGASFGIAGNAITEVAAGNETITVGGNRSLDVGGNDSVQDGGAYQHEVSGDFSLKGSSNGQIQTSGNLTIKGATVNIN